MQIFNQQKNNLSVLKEKIFKLEKDIQSLFENNLEVITSFKLIKSEFAIKNSRIDTLAFDEESKSFVIIEYKRNQNYSVIDQGVSYLNLMLEYKADFIVEYNETQKESLKRSDVDWSQSKIIFVSPSFTDFQKQSSNFKDLPIELWEIKQFEKEIIIINPIKKSKSAPNFKDVKLDNDSKIEKVAKEVKVYDEEFHLKIYPPETRELYESYKNAILNLSPDIEVESKKLYIAFKKRRNIVDIVTLKTGLRLFLNIKKGELDDPRNLMNDASVKGHWGNGDYEIYVSNTDNIEYIMSLVKQLL